MRILDGKKAAAALLEEVRQKVQTFRDQAGRPPVLRVILVGENPASQVYVRQKTRQAQEVGIDAAVLRFPETLSEEALLAEIHRLNRDPEVDGILVQLPLPEGIRQDRVMEAVAPEKDVDGFHPLNMGYLFSGQPRLVACTPRGILYLLQYYGIEVAGKRVVVIGRSTIVGRPMAALLLLHHATVTVVHSRTPHPERVAREADILIVAAGKMHLVDETWVKEGAVVVDVGIHRTPEGKLTGDVHAERVKDRVAWLSPVPGGVGPMTVAALMENVVSAASRRLEDVVSSPS